MPRSIFPMAIADISAFAKSMREQIDRLDHKPGHLEMLNLLSRAAGFTNYQHFRSAAKTTSVIENWNVVGEPEPVADEKRVLHTLRVFDREGRITRWPGKRSQQELCLWYIWSKIPRAKTFTEREISEFLNTLHLFGDAALLRRDLVDLALMQRKRDGSDYRRIEKKPPPELRLLTLRIGAPKGAARAEAA